MKSNKINEELGEIVCPICKGTGHTTPEITSINTLQIVCKKCQGTGKLDWCQQVVGVAPKPYFQFDSTAVTSTSMLNTVTNIQNDSVLIESTPNQKSSWFKDMYMSIIDKIVGKMSNDIDNEILRSFERSLEQNDKEKLIRSNDNDHRVFSELMFFPFIESKIKDKKD